MSIQQHTLVRTDGAPVCFVGELIASAQTLPECGPENRSRSHECNVYRTRTGKSWIVEILFWTGWDHERDTATVTVVRGADDVSGAQAIAGVLAAYDPCKPVTGYPIGPQFAAKQERLLAWHRSAWAELVSEVLAQLPSAAEVVE